MNLGHPWHWQRLRAFGSAAHAKDLLETARSAGHFTILLKALTAAGMDADRQRNRDRTRYSPR